jgi:hypothetical protein
MNPVHPHSLTAQFSRTGSMAALLTFVALPAQASFINNNFGLTGPHQTIDFESVALVTNQAVSTQFLSLGAAFTNAFGNPVDNSLPNFSGNRIGNFQGGIGNLGTLTMDFSSVLDQVAFALVSSPGTSTVQAYLNGLLVESNTALTDTSSSTNFYGFAGIQFNRVTLSVVSFDNALLIDNLQLRSADLTVPEPTGGALVMLALAGLCALGRHKPASRS